MPKVLGSNPETNILLLLFAELSGTFFLVKSQVPHKFHTITMFRTLNLFYKQRPNQETRWLNPDFDSGCLTVAYFGLKF